MKKFYGKRWLKIIVWMISLIALCTACVSGGALALNILEYQNGPYPESQNFRRSLYTMSRDVLRNAYGDAQAGSFSKRNLGFDVFRYTGEEEQTELIVSIRPDDYKITILLDYAYNPASGDYILQYSPGPSHSASAAIDNPFGNSAETGGITVYFSLPQSPDDAFYEDYQIYRKAQNFHDTGIAILCISGLIWLAAVIFLFAACGHTEANGAIALIRPDRVPFEIVAAVSAGIIAFCVNLPDFLNWDIDLPFIGGNDPFFIYLAFTAVCCYLIAMCALLSLARRLKAHRLKETTLCGWLAGLLLAFFRAVPYTPKVSAAACVLFVINAMAILLGIRGIQHFAVVAIDFIILLIVPLYAYSAQKLVQKSRMLSEGDLDLSTVKEESRFAPLFYRRISSNLNQISKGIEAAVSKQMKSERLKTELITNVSHDIRTPLTSIINYTDLLQKEADEEKRQEYLSALSRSSLRLKKLSEDLIEASKASSGNINAQLEKTDLNEIIQQALGEYEEKLSRAELTPVVNVHEIPLYAIADGRLLWRVLSNLLSNCVKYSQPGTRVYIETCKEGEDKVRITLKNVSRDILNVSSEELLERFVRGDSSRSTEGSGLGLNIAQSLCTVMNGSFRLTIDGDLFRADILLPAAADVPETAVKSVF